MNTAKKIYESDERGVVHVDLPVGAPGRRVEVVVVWQEVAESSPALEPGDDWSDLHGLLEGEPLERPAQGELEKRDTLG